MQSPKVSIYEKANDKQGKVTTLSEVIERIRTGADGLDGTTRYLNVISQTDPATYKIEKEKLKAFTPSGTFPPYKRKAKHLLAHSAHIIIDIDRLTPGQIADLLAELAQMPHVVLAFVSPSGTGIKVLVRVDPIPRNDLEHKGAYQACLDFFEDLTEEYGFTIDTGGKDCSRLCFLAHHPHPVVNTVAPAITWDRETYLKAEKEKQERFEAEAKKPYTGNVDIKALDYIDPNDLDYTQWLSVITACKKEGLAWQQADAWSRRGSKYTEGEVETRWDGLHLDVSWGAVVNLAKPNGYTPPHKHLKQKLYQIETPSQVSTQTLDENAEKREKATDAFLTKATEALHILLITDWTGTGKSYTALCKALLHGKRTLSLLETQKLAAQVVELATELGFKNALHLKGREHNWEQSGIEAIPFKERTETLFERNNCIACDTVKEFTDENLPAKFYCILSCPFYKDDLGNIICKHLQQFIGLEERDFIATSNPNLFFDPARHGYLFDLVNTTHETTDEELAIDAILGTSSKESKPFDLGIIDDYQISTLYPEKSFSEKRFKAIKDAWSDTHSVSTFASLMLKAFKKKKPEKILKAIRKAYESTTEHHALIAERLTQHARKGSVEPTNPTKGSKETQKVLAEKHILYQDGGKQYIPVNLKAFLELKDKNVPVVHPNQVPSDINIGTEVVVPHSPQQALLNGVKLNDLTPVWQTGVTPIDVIEMFLSQIGNPENAPIERKFSTQKNNEKPNAILEFTISPQAPVGIINQIAMLSATTPPEDTKKAFTGQDVIFSETTGGRLQFADGVEVYQYADARLTAGSVFDYQKDTHGKRKLQEEPTDLTATATKRLTKLNDWAKQADGLTAFISYKEFIRTPFSDSVNNFDIVTHFDEVKGLNFDGLKYLVIFGYPKVKHEIVIKHAATQYASDTETIPKGDKSLKDENGKLIPEYIQLTEEVTAIENGYEITERRYKYPQLEKIRKQLATDKIEQANGRARFVRWKDTTTLIFTNTPVENITDRATLFSDAAFYLAETPSELPAAMDRIKSAEETGDVQAVMETKDVSQRTAERETRPARKERDRERDAQIIKLHNEGYTSSEIETALKEQSYKKGISKSSIQRVLKRCVKNDNAYKYILIGDVANDAPPTNTDAPCIESETLHLCDPEPDHDTFFKLLDISACFYEKHQLSPSEVSQLTGIDESEVRRILDDWYQAVVISPGIGETYWMTERDEKNFTDKILAPTHRIWEQNFPGQKILCPPTLFNPNLNANASER